MSSIILAAFSTLASSSPNDHGGSDDNSNGDGDDDSSGGGDDDGTCN